MMTDERANLNRKRLTEAFPGRQETQKNREKENNGRNQKSWSVMTDHIFFRNAKNAHFLEYVNRKQKQTLKNTNTG